MNSDLINQSPIESQIAPNRLSCAPNSRQKEKYEKLTKFQSESA